MGTLRGDVDILGLGNILQLLSMNQKEGVFTLLRGPEKKSIFISPSGMRLLSSNMVRVNILGKILLRRKVIQPSDLDDLLNEQKILGWKLGKIAITSGLATEQDLVDSLREQIEEDIFDMFMWSNATFEFREGPAPREIVDNPLAGISFDSNITSLILEAARRADELLQIRRLVHDEEGIVIPEAEAPGNDPAATDPETAASVLALIDGRRSVRQIADASGLPRYAVRKAIANLIQKKRVRIVTPHRDKATSSVSAPPSHAEMHGKRTDQS